MDIKQKIYWGWYVVLGAFLILGINYGARYCFGVFVKPMSLEYHWSRSVISLGASLMILSYGIGGIVSGYLLDRMAPRWIMTIGATVAATGLILTGLCSHPGSTILPTASCAGWEPPAWSRRLQFLRGKMVHQKKRSSDRDGIGRNRSGHHDSLPSPGYIVQVSWAGFIFLGLLIFIGVVSLAQGLMKKIIPRPRLWPDGIRKLLTSSSPEIPFPPYFHRIRDQTRLACLPSPIFQ
jgi:MFS family permease